MTCYRRLNKKENRSIFFLLFDQSKEKKKAYLVGCKLGFQNVTVGRINRVAAWTGFSYKKMH